MIRLKTAGSDHQKVVLQPKERSILPSFGGHNITFVKINSSPAQTFAGKILKTQRSSKMFFFPPEIDLGTCINLYSFESS